MEPTYRIATVPAKPKENLIDSGRDEIRDILRDPPRIRENGFGFRGVDRIGRIKGGITGTGLAQQAVTLFKNGLLELSCPLLNRHFQWYKTEKGFSHNNWLYPYTIAEMPLTFMLMAQKLYLLSGYSGKLIIQQDYFNIKEFVLVPGHPSAPGFGFFKDELKLFDQQNIEGDQYQYSVYDNAWVISARLISEVYDSFQLSKEVIPKIRELSFRFSFDYQEFMARYNYIKQGIQIEILNEHEEQLKTFQFSKGEYLDEMKAISRGIELFKKQVQKEGHY